jgi:putative aldouronate transport system permease protein
MIRMTRAEKIFNVFNVFFFFIVSVAILLPVAFVLKKSFDVGAAGQLNLSIIPREFSTLYYNVVLHDQGIYRPFLNSIYLTVVGTLLSVIFNAMGAYTLSKPNLPGQRILMYLIVVAMMFSGGLLPLYLVVRALKMTNKLNGLIALTLINGWNMILIRNFYNSLPASLGESAMLDGAGEFTIFRRIVVPLSTPVIAAISLFTGVGYWNTFFYAVIFITKPELYTFQVKLQQIISVQQMMETQFDQMMGSTNASRGNLNSEGVASAIIIISIIPIIIVYPYLQRYFATGIMVGSLKG